MTYINCRLHYFKQASFNLLIHLLHMICTFQILQESILPTPEVQEPSLEYSTHEAVPEPYDAEPMQIQTTTRSVKVQASFRPRRPPRATKGKQKIIKEFILVKFNLYYQCWNLFCSQHLKPV